MAVLNKYRGRHITTGEWLYGSLYNDGGEEYILPAYPGSAIDYEDFQVDPNTVGVFTEHLDSAGNEVYQGDILRFPAGFWPEMKGYVVFEDDALWVKSLRSDRNYTLKWFLAGGNNQTATVVIGNVHDKKV